MSFVASTSLRTSRPVPTSSSPCLPAGRRKVPGSKCSAAGIEPPSSRSSMVSPLVASEQCRSAACRNSDCVPLIHVNLPRRQRRTVASRKPSTREGRAMLRCILAALAALVLVTVTLIPDEADARGGRGGGGYRGGGGVHRGGAVHAGRIHGGVGRYGGRYAGRAGYGYRGGYYRRGLAYGAVGAAAAYG